MSIYRRLTGVAGAVAAAVPVYLSLPATGYAQIEEITVTARRREESLQDVPLAVTALSAQQIQRQGISGLADIANLDPSLQFDTAFGPADTRITIRGLSNTRGRSNAAFLVDGIDVTTENLNAAGSGLLANRRLLADVERIEVVKGPQSALYGRAAFAGALSYVTRSPGDEFEGRVGWELGNYGIKQFDFAVGGPLIDNVLGMRVSGVWYEGDGFYKNSISGQPVGDYEGYGYAVTTEFTPTDELRFKLRGEFSKENIGPLPNIRIGGGRQGYNLRLFEYPEGMLTPVPGVAALIGQPNPNPGATSTGILSFGQWCPPELQDPTKGPGWCIPQNFGSGRGKQVAQNEDPLTGQDFKGTELQTFRLALETNLDVGFGTFTAYTGWTDFEGRDAYDQDWQAEGRPDRLGLPLNSPFLVPQLYGLTPPPGFTVPENAGWSTQISRSVTDTKQFSQELRFATDLQGPLNFTAGALYWSERRRLEDSAVITFCTLTRRSPDGLQLGPGQEPLEIAAGNFCNGLEGTFDSWQDYLLALQPQVPGIWRADTRHWSFYGLVEWDITDRWTAGFETRFVSETFNFTKPNQSSCTQFFGPNPGGTQALPAGAICSTNFVLGPEFSLGSLPPAQGTQGTRGYRKNRGQEVSRFSTPKAFVQWQATDDMQLYFSWAKGQKPGGITATPGGGSPTAFEGDRFDPEKVTAWELGMKSDWFLGGFWRINSAIFFQDFTDKQVSTQVEQDGFLKPVVLNASSAEVWGLELEALWQPEWIDGLTLNAAWTYLDATYGEFFDETRAPARIALIQQCDPVVRGEGAGAQVFCRTNLTGKRLERTPRNAFNLGANLTRPFADTQFDWFIEGNASYQGRRFLEAENEIFLKAYWLVNARLGLLGDRWEFLLYVDNVFDDRTIKTGGAGPDFGNQVVELGFAAGLGANHWFGTLPDPRVFGLRASYRFGAGF
ncbi:MAG: TonB-dependent receptor [Chromatiales bacterium]|nr:TonB-dependent receptor [Chromatiales bacterium]